MLSIKRHQIDNSLLNDWRGKLLQRNPIKSFFTVFVRSRVFPSLSYITLLATTHFIPSAHTPYAMDIDETAPGSWIFVGSDDSHIAYEGPWVANEGAYTAESSKAQYHFSYAFNGTSFRAIFAGNVGLTSSSCKLDGTQQSVLSFEGGFKCSSNEISSNTAHNLSFSLNVNSDIVFFKGLFFRPAKVSHRLARTIDFRSPQDSGTFSGVGNPFPPSTQPPQTIDASDTFTSPPTATRPSRPFSMSTSKPSPTFIFPTDTIPVVSVSEATQPLGGSSPSLTMSISTSLPGSTTAQTGPNLTLNISNTNTGSGSGSGSGSTPTPSDPLVAQSVTVQGSSPSMALDSSGQSIIDTVVNSSAASPTSTNLIPSSTPVSQGHHRISNGIIAAIIVIALLILFVIALWIWRRIVARKQAAKNANPDSVGLRPFSLPNQSHTGRIMLAQYTTTEKTDKYRQAFGIGITTTDSESSSTQLQENTISAAGNTERQPRSLPVRYRVHEDGGELVVDGGGPSEEEEVIDLPPVYTTLVARPQHRPSSTPGTSV